MAFPSTGVHVLCTYAIPPGGAGMATPVLAWAGDVWSEPVASGSVTANVALGGGSGSGKPIFSIRAFADGWIAIGPGPDASQASGVGNTARKPVTAGEVVEIGVNPRDKLAFTAA